MAPDSSAYLTTRASLDCRLFCDGESLLLLKANQIKKIAVPIGQHILQYVSVENPTLCVERVMDFSMAGRNYLLLLDDMKGMVEQEVAARKQAEEKAKEELRRKLEEEARAKAEAEDRKRRAEAEARERAEEEIRKRALEREEAEEKEKAARMLAEDYIGKYLRFEPGAETFSRFLQTVESNLDIVTVIPSVDSAICPAARSGNLSADVVLGVLHELGLGVNKDHHAALSHLMNAAEKGNDVAQWLVGMICLDDNPSDAWQWLFKSSEQGNLSAMVQLGNCCSGGIGVSENKEEALEWYQKAAESGFAPAQHKMGSCFHFYEGFSHDPTIAVQWYCKAIEQGYAPSMNNLGVCYSEGNGVPKDQTEAIKWYMRAAEKNLVVAICNLGRCYENGNGVPKDMDEAVKYFQRAAALGDTWAREHLEGIEEAKKQRETRERIKSERAKYVTVLFSWSEPYYYCGVRHECRKSRTDEMTRDEYLALLASGRYGIATYMKGRFGYDYDNPSIELLGESSGVL